MACSLRATSVLDHYGLGQTRSVAVGGQVGQCGSDFGVSPIDADVPDLDTGVSFWAAALGAAEEPLPESSSRIYRHLRLPDSNIRVLLQKTDDEKLSPKERMHLDVETDDVEAEVKRLETLGATRWDHQQERGFDFWVMRDPWDNEFCVLQTEFPELLAQRNPWDD